MDDKQGVMAIQGHLSANSKAFEVYDDTCHKRKHVETVDADDRDESLESPSHIRDSYTGAQSYGDSLKQRHVAVKSNQQTSSLRARTPLANNRLKVNSTPRSNSQRSIKTSLSIERSPSQKYRLQDEHLESPRKSSKTNAFDSPSSNQRFASLTVSPDFMHTSNDDQSANGSPARASKFQEGSMNDRTSKCPPPEIIGLDFAGDDPMEIDSVPVNPDYSTFDGGNTSTPRPTAMYNFNSAAKTWNPFKAIGKLFTWPANTSSPSKHQEQALNSKEIAEQVEAHLQGIEDRILGRLAALKAGDVHKSTPDLLTRTIENASNDVDPETITEGLHVMSTNNSASFSTPNLLNQSSKSGDYTAHSDGQQDSPAINHELSRDLFASLHRLSGKASMAFRNSISPTKSRAVRTSGESLREPPTKSKTIKPQLSISNMLNLQSMPEHSKPTSPEDDCNSGNKVQSVESRAASSLEFKELPELPGLKNKASQHLKKMASKMNLRNRKPKREDALLVNNHEYRVMKKKNKEDILKDYLVLQKEKQELEKKLAHDSAVPPVAISIEESSSKVSSPDDQLQRENESTTTVPVLLSTTTPDFGMDEPGREATALEDVERNPMKREVRQMSKPLISPSLPLELIHEDLHENRYDDNTGIDDRREQTNDVTNLEESAAEKPVQHLAGTKAVKSSPVRMSTVKTRSRVPKLARESKVHTPKGKGEAWTGWDDDVF